MGSIPVEGTMRNVNSLNIWLLAFLIYGTCTTFAQLVKKHSKNRCFRSTFVAFKQYLSAFIWGKDTAFILLW